ncbi:MAG: TatD family hydrolase [Bacilli bacterium]|nr:TatD family hydrolase [Bacilli bacterium]
MYIDTHLHLNKEDDVKKIIKEATDANVQKLVISGCDKKGITEALEISSCFENVYTTIGFHPSEVIELTDDDIIWLETLITSNNKVLGVGEIGLDYYYGKENKEKQLYFFKKQLELAEKLALPVVIHSREAFEDTYNTLKEHKLKGVIHCFSGSLETAKLYIKLGYVLGVGGVLTFKNSRLPEVIKTINLNNVVLETDSPYLAPTPHRGEINYPKYIPIIAKKISEIKKISTKDVENITSSNVSRIFDLKI